MLETPRLFSAAPLFLSCAFALAGKKQSLFSCFVPPATLANTLGNDQTSLKCYA